MACGGDASKTCGGPWLLSVYSAGIPKIASPPAVVPTVGAYSSIGCWTDTVGARALGDKLPALGANNTVEGCAAACTGYNFFGVEYGDEVSCAFRSAGGKSDAPPSVLLRELACCCERARGCHRLLDGVRRQPERDLWCGQPSERISARHSRNGPPPPLPIFLSQMPRALPRTYLSP
jgi:hypothetical protein